MKTEKEIKREIHANIWKILYDLQDDKFGEIECMDEDEVKRFRRRLFRAVDRVLEDSA